MSSYWKCGLVAVAALGLGLCPTVVRANVYASGVVVDSSAIGTTCGTLKVTYVLNEAADGDGTNPGVKIEVLNSGQPPVVVRTVTIARQKKGMHVFEWDGRDNSGIRVLDGQYTVRITAADLGYSVWTRISDEAALDAGNGVNWNYTHFERPLGVSVGTNPNRPNYGKIFVSQATGLTTGSGRPMTDGIYMLNADCSDAGHATGGVNWAADGTSYSTPMRSIIGPDNHLYVVDYFADNVYEFSEDLSTATVVVGRSIGNFSASQYVRGVWVTGTQAEGNRVIYCVNSNYGDTARKGVIRYTLNGDATATGTGDQYIGPTYYGASYGFYPYDIVMDSAGNAYVNTYRASPGQAKIISQFTPDVPLPNNTPAWEAPDTYTYADGLTINEARGWVVYGHYSTGFVYFFKLIDGSFVQSFDAGNRIRDLVFDDAGNLYTVDNSLERLRAWSPPDGPNMKSTTSGAATFLQTGTGGPMITAQPQDVTFCANGSAQFSVAATASVPGDLTYQWKENGVALVDDGVNVLGATTANLTLNNVAAARAGNLITVVVCDQTGPDTGVAVSNPAILKVGISIIQQPLSQTVCHNTDVTFTVSAQGVGAVSYQWQRDVPPIEGTYEDILGETGTTLILSNVQGADSTTRIRCLLRDDCNPAPADPIYTAAAILTVSTGPILSHVGYGGTVAVGGTLTMTCYASGTGVLHYQWLKDDVLIDGATQGSYTITDANCTEDSGLYSCAVTDDCGTTVRSTDLLGNPATVTVGGGAEVCGNGLDDDCDGLVDCEDSDCDNDPNCVPACHHQPFADYDDDLDVDQADFAVFQRCFTGVNATIQGDECYCFDRDGDGKITLDDFAAFLACASGPGIPADPTCDDYPTGDVIINEFAYDMITSGGAATTDTREFVELYNRGNEAVDIAGWTLRASDTVAPPADNNRDFVIPTTSGGPTWLNPGAYYVLGSGLVPNVNLIISPGTEIWENENDALQLLDRNGDVRDTVIYNGYLGTVAVSPGEGRIWGRFEMNDYSLLSLSRYLDGLDTNNNGRDFGSRQQTPGANNLGASSMISTYVPPNVDGQGTGTDVAGLAGSFVNPRVIDPTIADANNFNVIPASPQGGNAIVAWDPAGGGNSAVSIDLMNGNGAYDLWVYFDTNPVPDNTPGAETSYFGIMGTTGAMNYSLANFPDPEALLLGDTVTSNGSTGLAWVYNKNHGGQTRKLYLVDAKDGGDSSPGANSPQYWSVLATIDMSTVPSGWYRLSLSYTSATGAVSGTFDNQTFTGTTATGLIGTFYIGYQESYVVSPVPVTARPPTFDLKP